MGKGHRLLFPLLAFHFIFLHLTFLAFFFRLFPITDIYFPQTGDIACVTALLPDSPAILIVPIVLPSQRISVRAY